MNAQEYAQYWQQHIDQCQSLGLSGAAYCKQHTLSYYKFVYWRSKLRDGGSEARANSSTGFVKVVPVQRSAATLTLMLPDGVAISGFNATNIDLLGAVLRQL